LIPDSSLEQRGLPGGWQDSLGGIAKAVVEPNLRIWSGDHCSVYPPLSRHPVQHAKLNARSQDGDVMPTILDIYGVKPRCSSTARALGGGR